MIAVSQLQLNFPEIIHLNKHFLRDYLFRTLNCPYFSSPVSNFHLLI